MQSPRGHFSLQTERDLLGKLEREYERLTRNPLDADTCFNFFVTAEHLPEWITRADTQAASRMRKDCAVLRICSHLANGAKHFETKDSRHRSIGQTATQTIITYGSVPGVPNQEFVVTLTPVEATDYGKNEIGVTELAARVLEYFRNILDPGLQGR